LPIYFYITETALVKISNDILSAKDRGEETTIVMFDPSAAFETMDHDIMILHHENSFEINSHS
jgi:hypothetical protein